MSRVGKSPIPVPKGAEVTISGLNVTVKGPLGTLNHTLNTCIGLSQADGFINVERKDDTVESAALSGTTRALVNNMVIGVTTGFYTLWQVVNNVVGKTELQFQGIALRSSTITNTN